MKLTTNNRNARLGFTILELVIVLVILVAILAIVGPRLMRSQQKADIKLTQIQIANLETSLKEYAVDMKRYPVTEDGLAALFRQPTDENTSSRWSGPYLDGSELLSMRGATLISTDWIQDWTDWGVQSLFQKDRTVKSILMMTSSIIDQKVNRSLKKMRQLRATH